MKILSIVGARPQFIKLGPLSQKIRQRFNEVIVHTGQHFDKEMSELFFNELELPEPDYNLNINSGNHGEQTGKMLIELERVIKNEKPSLIVIFGDTNSTLAGALAGSKLKVKIIHVEAGLRSFNREMPEEINRIAADHISDFLFAPTNTAMDHLKREGLGDRAYFTGDIMADSLRMAVTLGNKRKPFKITHKYFLLTLHRPYNVDDPEMLCSILSALGRIDTQIIFPVHPRTKSIIEKNELKVGKNIVLTRPMGYLDFVQMQSGAEMIITDSGGIQKEAYMLKKPCITLRSETEWVETVRAGWNLLLNPSLENDIAKKILDFHVPQHYEEIFGNNAADKMMELIERFD